MKLPRRAAAGLAAFLMAASLALAPSVGRAHYIDGPLNNPPPRDGDPDTPAGSPQSTGWTLRLWLGRIGVVRVSGYFLLTLRPNSETVRTVDRVGTARR